MKTCSKCRQSKPYTDFDKHSKCIGGVVSTCKICRKHYQELNKNRDNAQRRAKYAKDPANRDAGNKQYYQRKQPQISEYYKAYISKNRARFRHYYNAKSVEYVNSKKQQTPVWLTKSQKKQMIGIYRDCLEGFEVDHIIPLQGKAARGLHVPWNLQYLPMSVNRRKSNKLEYLAKSDSQSKD